MADVARVVSKAPRAVNVPYAAGWLGTVILDLASKINSVAGGISGALLTRPALGAPRNLMPPLLSGLPFPIPRAALVAAGQLRFSPAGLGLWAVADKIGK